MKILSFGNSFSDDAHTYLHRIAAADGCEIYTVNLNIGGCSLERHYNNMKDNAKSYMFQENGIITDKLISIEEGLLLEDWDVVTLQQVSCRSFDEDSYYPYINELAKYIRRLAPKAKIFIHETWAYENGSDRIKTTFGDESSEKMLSAIRKAYTRAKCEINADGIIPSGELFLAISKDTSSKLHRDAFHASYGLGRYALGLLWYRSLTGASVTENSFSDFEEPVSPEDIAIAKRHVQEFNKII